MIMEKKREDGKKEVRECMEWTDGGAIMVYRTGCLHRKQEQLTIQAHANDGPKSVAKVSDSTILTEARKRRNSYYGVFPASAFHLSRTKVTVIGSIPTIQMPEKDSNNPRLYKADMANHGYMYAVKHKSENNDNFLEFKPLVNTYVFKIHSPAENYIEHKLMRITLRSEQKDIFLSGTFRTRLNPKTGRHTPVEAKNLTRESNHVSVFFEQGIMLGKSPEEEIIISLLALPMKHTDLILSLRFENGLFRNLRLINNNAPISIDACQRVVFSNIRVPGEIRGERIDEQAGPFSVI